METQMTTQIINKKNKRLIILYISDLLEQGTSITKPFSITRITNALNKLGVECERRTVSRNVNYLIAYGKPIVKLKNGKVYYDKTKENKL